MKTTSKGTKKYSKEEKLVILEEAKSKGVKVTVGRIQLRQIYYLVGIN